MKNTKLLVTSLTVALGFGTFIGANVNKVSKADAAPYGESGKINVYFAGLGSFDHLKSVNIAVNSNWAEASKTISDADKAIGEYKYSYTTASNQTTLNAYMVENNGSDQYRHPACDGWDTDYSVIDLGTVTPLIPGHSYVITFTGWERNWDNWEHAWFNYTFSEYTTLDPASETKNTYYVHDPNGVLGDTLANVKVYGFGQASSVEPMDWPGTHDGVTAKTLGRTSAHLYQVDLSISYSKLIMNSGSVQTSNVEDLADHIGDVLVIGDETAPFSQTFYTYWREVEYYTDCPEFDGYYILGSEIGWDFAHGEAYQFTANPDFSPLDTDGNVAVYYGYTAVVDEEVQIKSYINNVPQWHAAAGDYSEPNNFGYIVTEGDEADNFHFTKAGSYDFFCKDGHFYVAVHKERYTVAVTHVLFDGKLKTGTEAGTNQIATEGQKFTPANPSKENYVLRGFYTDPDCTVAYSPAAPTSGFTLYAKFTRVCYYLFGDDTYAGGTDKGWNVDYALPVSAGTGNNELEGAVIIPEGASSVNPVKVKPLLYDGELQPRFYALGAEREYVTIDGEGNFSFTAKGTYAFYVSNDKDGSGNSYVYFEANAQSFYTKFKTEMDDVCDEAAGNTNLANLKAAWGRVKEFYLACSDSAKAEVYAIGFDGGDPKGDDGERFVASYYYIVNKYGTNNVEDFIWNNEIIRSAPSTSAISSSSTDFVNYAIIAASGVLILVEVSFLLLKRRKKNI